MTLTRENLYRMIESRFNSLNKENLNNSQRAESYYLEIIIKLEHTVSKHEKRISELEERISQLLKNNV